MDYIGYEETDKTIPPEIDLNSTKTCTTCKMDKPLKEFYVNYKIKNSVVSNHIARSVKRKKLKNNHKRETRKVKGNERKELNNTAINGETRTLYKCIYDKGL